MNVKRVNQNQVFTTMFIDNKTFVTSFSCVLSAPRWGLPWSPRERHPPGTLYLQSTIERACV